VTSVIAAERDGRWVEYAGGYTDMLAQRGPMPATVVPAVTRPKLATAARPQQAGRSSRRMTFKDRHALETLPASIAALQGEVANLSSLLADLDLYVRDPARFGAMTKALGRAQDALAVAEEQWLTLEMLREEIEG
jgi:ATP-binding cassette subfamily F protein uup